MLVKILASFARPPEAESTNGVNEECSTSLTRCS